MSEPGDGLGPEGQAAPRAGTLAGILAKLALAAFADSE